MASPSRIDQPAIEKRLSGKLRGSFLHGPTVSGQLVSNFQPIPPPPSITAPPSSSTQQSGVSSTTKIDAASPDRAMADRTAVSFGRMSVAESNFEPAADYGLMPPMPPTKLDVSLKRQQSDVPSSGVSKSDPALGKKPIFVSLPKVIPYQPSGSAGATPERLRLLSSSPEAGRITPASSTAAGGRPSPPVATVVPPLHMRTSSTANSSGLTSVSPGSPHSPSDESGLAPVTPPSAPSPPPTTGSPRATLSPSSPKSPKSPKSPTPKSPSPPPLAPTVTEPPLFSRLVAPTPPEQPVRPKLVSSYERDSRIDNSGHLHPPHLHHFTARTDTTTELPRRIPPSTSAITVTAPHPHSSAYHHAQQHDMTSPSSSSPPVAPKPSSSSPVSLLLLRNYAESIAVGKMAVVYMPMPPVPEPLQRPTSPPGKGPLVPLMTAAAAAYSAASSGGTTGPSVAAASSSTSLASPRSSAVVTPPPHTAAVLQSTASVAASSGTSAVASTVAAPASSSSVPLTTPSGGSTAASSHVAVGSTAQTHFNLPVRVLSGNVSEDLMASAQRAHRASSPITYTYIAEVPPLPPATATASGNMMALRTAQSNHLAPIDYQPMPRVPSGATSDRTPQRNSNRGTSPPPAPSPYASMPPVTYPMTSTAVSATTSGTISPPGSRKNLALVKSSDSHTISAHRISVQTPNSPDEFPRKDRITKPPGKH